MKALRYLFAGMLFVGLAGNVLVLPYVMWLQVSRRGILAFFFDPMLDLQLALDILMLPLFWIMLAMSLVGFFGLQRMPAMSQKELARSQEELARTRHAWLEEVLPRAKEAAKAFPPGTLCKHCGLPYLETQECYVCTHDGVLSPGGSVLDELAWGAAREQIAEALKGPVG